MARYCPISGRRVVYLDCMECDDYVACRNGTLKVKPKTKCLLTGVACIHANPKEADTGVYEDCSLCEIYRS